MQIGKKHVGATVAALVLFGLIALAVIVHHGFSARTEPSLPEALMARTMRSLAVPSKAKSMRNPLPPDTANINAGMEHFADHCATCHSNNGSGNTMFGLGMYPKPPDMRTGRTQKMTDGEIYYTIQNGVRLTGMPAFGENPSDDDEGTWQLVHFIRHLPRVTDQELEEMRKWNPKSPADTDEEKSEEDFLNGSDAPPKPSMQHKQH